MEIEDLPDRFEKDGKVIFSYEKVREVLNKVEKGYQEFDYTVGTKFAVITETSADVQTIFAVVE